MKKILLFTVSFFLLTACEKEEIIYEQPPQGGGQELPNPDEDISFDARDGVTYYSSSSQLDFSRTKILINNGPVPSRVAIRLYQNGIELEPHGEYWDYEKNPTNERHWFRPYYIELSPDQIQGTSIQVQLFVFPEEGPQFKFVREITVNLTLR